MYVANSAYIYGSLYLLRYKHSLRQISFDVLLTETLLSIVDRSKKLHFLPFLSKYVSASMTSPLLCLAPSLASFSHSLYSIRPLNRFMKRSLIVANSAMQ